MMDVARDGKEQQVKQVMQRGGCSEEAVSAFLNSYRKLFSGATGLIAESDISPLASVPDLETLSVDERVGQEALQQTLVIKLNGGLGTSMGLAKAKSLLPVKDDLSFLDIISQQMLWLRGQFEAEIPLLFMNSFRTEDDTLRELDKRGMQSKQELPLSFLQNRVPKIDANSFLPINWPEEPELEWCPPGHGDIYVALQKNGLLGNLIEAGFRYAFVSNADNLGATLDIALLSYFASSGASFLMEVADRTAVDRKGGHIAQAESGGLILRERAQCADEDLEDFQDIKRHRYFNTNSLWIDLVQLQEILAEQGGYLDLPLIRNRKNVNPADDQSPPVYQLETAMGAAISAFPQAAAVRVPRSRFAPVKTTNDLLLLWSDAMILDSSYHVRLSEDLQGNVPVVELDPAHYKTIADFSERFPYGAPSLKNCQRLSVQGDFLFEKGVVVTGDVKLENTTADQKVIAANTVLR